MVKKRIADTLKILLISWLEKDNEGNLLIDLVLVVLDGVVVI